MKTALRYIPRLVGLLLLALCAGGTVHAQSDINLTGYTLVFSDEFTNGSWTPNSPKGSYKWRSQPPTSSGIYGFAIRDQNCLSISNGVLIDKLTLVTGTDNSGSYCGGPVGMKDGSGNALVTVGTLGPQINTHSGWQWYGWIGLRFTTQSGGLTVSQLGRYAISSNTQVDQVRIFDAVTGDDVAKALVNCSGQSGWVYAPIIGGNITLAGSHAYYLMTDNYSGEDYFYSGSTTVTASGGVTINNSVWGGWHSGSLYSVDTVPAGFAQQYGYLEMRAKMPASGVGSWPSFWCDTTNAITGAACNEEIDILEWYGLAYDGNSDYAQQASHNWGFCGSDQSVYNPHVDVPGARPWADYHIYGFQSDPTNITFYIDGVQSLRCATPTNYLTCGLDLRLEYALGGGWPLTNVVANSHYDIDWVRVWALSPPPPPPPPPPAAIGVQFYENSSRGQDTVLNGTQPTSGTVNLNAGVAAVARINWNSITGSTDSRSIPLTASNLVDSTGATTTAALRATGYFYGGGGGFSGSDPNQIGDNALASNQLLALGGAEAVVDLSQIPYSQYDLYVYLACDAANRSGTVTIGSSTKGYTTTPVSASGNTSQWITSSNASVKSDYLLFSGLTGNSQHIVVNVSGNGGINGFQIVGNPAPDRIPLTVNFAAGNVTLTWTNSVFQLQSATNVSGPYTKVLGAASPYSEPASGTQKFYRLFWNGQ